jgi:hypothetical protein
MSYRDGPCRCGAATYRPPRFMGRRMARRCEDCDYIVGRCACRVSLVVHLCPPGDEALMPCCGISPHERMGDRITLDARRVTCPFYTGAAA